MTQPLPPAGDLGPFFAPKSVAILGASSDPDKIGGVPVAMLKRAGFAGPIYPVNPSQPVIQGLPAYAAVGDIPGTIDIAILALPAKMARAGIEACLAKGARGIVMFTAGLGEVSEEGKALQRALASLCRHNGARLLGPNSLGLFSPYEGVFLTFSASLQHTWPRKGGIGIASQSGAVGSFCYAMLHDRGLGISRFIATGNEADIDVAACIDWMAGDPATTVIVAYIEGAQDGPALRTALLKARRSGKPVIVLKVGNTEAGAAAVASHTGSLAGSATAYEAIFAEAGACQARSIGELADMTEAAATGVKPRGNRLAVITPSGGVGVMLADQAVDLGLEMSPLPEEAQKEILSLIPFANPVNPVDTTAQVVNDMSLLPRIHDIMVEQGGYDIVITFLVHMGRNAAIMDLLVPRFAEMRRRHPGTVFIVSTFTTPDSRLRLQQAGFLVFDEPSQALRVAAGMRHLWRAPAADVATAPEARLALPAGPVDEAAATAALAAQGLPFPPSGLARSAREAADMATAIGFPVALKVVSPDIQHKSDVGGVRLGLRGPAEVEAAWHEMMCTVAERQPEAAITGALVTRMVTGGVETVIGAYRDPVFGPIMMFGLGGIFIEVFKDVVFRPAPLDRAGALEMIGAVKAADMLTRGIRGRAAVDIAALADALVRVSQVAAANAGWLESIEINPFMALPEGGFAVDALVLAGADTPL